MLFPLLTSLLPLLSLTNALSLPLGHLKPRQIDPELAVPTTSPSCIHGPQSRACWTDQLSVNTDYATTLPSTGATVEYWLTIQNSTLSPDGFGRMMLTFNGTYPGPPIVANWGDTIKVHITNTMSNNGTSIHFHGIRQFGTPSQDGVSGVTQCPVPPGGTITYTFRATQYGTSWYHSHYALQYAEGLAGPLIINGPASSNYDEDVGAVMLTEWYHRTAFETWDYAVKVGLPQAQNGLINGMNVYNGQGQRWEANFTAGKKYRLRFINAGIETAFRISIDGHRLKVIAVDFVPIMPYWADSIMIAEGQRYDVIVDANADPSQNYWLRTVVQTTCSEGFDSPDNMRGIIRYSGAPTTGDPTTPRKETPENCDDEPMSSLVPIVGQSVPKVDLTSAANLFFGLTLQPIMRWPLGGQNGTSTRVDWSEPTLKLLKDNGTYPAEANIIELPEHRWYYFVIEETQARFSHPIHLHGHDFHVLYQASGPFDPAVASANARWDNPTRRDVAMLPGNGTLVIAFEADNPGVWVLHCHVPWHVGGGMALQFLERKTEIPPLQLSGGDLSQPNSLDDNCRAWDAWEKATGEHQEDSGLKRRRIPGAGAGM